MKGSPQDQVFVVFTNLGDHEDENGHGRRLLGLLDAVVLPVVVVVVGSEWRGG